MERIFYSQNFTSMVSKFETNLINRKSIFSPIVILIPSIAYKEEIIRKIVDSENNKGILGFKFLLFNQLQNFLYQAVLGKNLPSKTAFFLQIEKEILKILKDENCLKYPELKRFVEKNASISSKRIHLLSQDLAAVFLELGIFENKKDQLKQPWQERIYEILMLPYIEEFQQAIKNNQFSFQGQIHFFCIPYFDAGIHKLFEHLGKTNQIYHYFYFPTDFFFADILTKHQKRFWNKHHKEHTVENISVIDDFLSNFIQMKKKQFEYFDDRLLEEEDDDFEAVEESFFLASFQRTLQTGILSSARFDDSIQIDLAPSPLREVQVLYNQIMDAFQKDHSLSFSDVVVYAPDISEYAPYIHFVFNMPQSPFKYRIASDLATKGKLLEGLENFFLNIDSHELLLEKFLQNESILKKMRISKEDSVKAYEIFKNAYILENFEENLEEGFLRILSSITFDQEKQRELEKPFAFEIDSSFIPVLEKIFKTIRLWKEDLRFFMSRPVLTVDEWIKKLQAIIQTYFSFESEKNHTKIQLDEFFLFLKTLSLSESLSYETFYHLYEDFFMNNKISFNMNDWNAILFSSIDSASFASKKIVAVIGLTEDFPKTMDDVSYILKKSLFPSKSQRQKDSFLNILLSAKKHLFLSAPFQKIEGRKTLSLLILEMIGLFKKMEPILEKETEDYMHFHPAHFFDESYFMENAKRKSYIKAHYITAQVYYNQLRQKLLNQELRVTLKNRFTLKDLQSFYKHPLKYFFHSQEIFFKSKEDLFLLPTPLDLYVIRKDVLTNQEKVTSFLEKQGAFTKQPVSKIFQKHLKNEENSLFNFMEEQGLNIGEMKSLDFVETAEQRSFQKDKLLIPGFPFEGKEGELVITGRIENVHEKGLLLNAKDSLEVIFENLPTILFYYYACMKDSSLSPTVYFLRANTSKELHFPNYKEVLTSLIALYEKNCIKPSFLLSQLIKPIIEKKESSFSSKLSGLSRNLDPYLEAAIDLCGSPKFSEIVIENEPYLESCFKDVIDWKGK